MDNFREDEIWALRKKMLYNFKTIVVACVSNFFFFLSFNIPERQKMKRSRAFLPSGRCWDHDETEQQKQYISILYSAVNSFLTITL